MVISNPMFQPSDGRAKPTPPPQQDGDHECVRREVCKACGDAAVAAAQRAAEKAEAEKTSLQLQLLDLESDVLFDFNSLQDHLLELQDFAGSLQRQLEESEQKRLREQELKTDLERQVLQMSEEFVHLKLQLSQRSHTSPTASTEAMSRASSAEQPGTPDCEDASMAMSASTALDTEPSSNGSDGAAHDEVASLRQEYRALTEDILKQKHELSQQLAAATTCSFEAERASGARQVGRPPFHGRLWPVNRQATQNPAFEVPMLGV